MLAQLSLFLLVLPLFGNFISAVTMGSPQCDLCGTWLLVDRIDRTAKGEMVPEPGLGSDPIGILIYDRAGNVCAQLMKRNRQAANLQPSTPQNETNQNNSATVGGYDAYFGTFEIDPQKQIVTHHIKGAIAAADVGRSVTRNFQLSAGELLLFFDTSNGGIPVRRTLRWKRVA